jgi:hypothetical protein
MMREGDRSSGFTMSWPDTFVQALKNNEARCVTYVPDNVLTPLIKSATSDNCFVSVNVDRSAAHLRLG